MNSSNNCSRSGMRGAVLPDAVHRDVQADILVEEQVQVGMEEDGVAAMPDDVQAVAVLVIEAERHRRQRRKWLVGRRMHQLRGLRD